MSMSAEYGSKFCSLQMSEKFSNGTTQGHKQTKALSNDVKAWAVHLLIRSTKKLSYHNLEQSYIHFLPVTIKVYTLKTHYRTNKKTLNVLIMLVSKKIYIVILESIPVL